MILSLQTTVAHILNHREAIENNDERAFRLK